MTNVFPASGAAGPDPDRRVPFTEFYRSRTPRLVALLRWQGASLPDAADCAQDTMLKAFQRWGQLQHPYSWCRITASREWARRAGRREHPTGDPESTGVPLLRPDVEIETFEARHDFLVLIDQLPDRQRQIMALHYDGATPNEIAEALRITPEAVRSSLFKARTALRNLRSGGAPT